MSSYDRTIAEHRESILQAVAPLPPQLIALQDALGLVLAADITASLAVPPFSNSAMDGYLVHATDVESASEDSPVTLRVIADQPAGAADAPAPEPGTAVRIMTGSLVPGLDEDPSLTDVAIVPVEDTDQPVAPGAAAPDAVEIRRPTSPGRHIRRAGEDITPGDLVIPAGTVLGPRDLAALSSTGHGTVPAHPRLRVGILATGDELIDPGQPLAAGQIPESNSIMVAGLVRDLGHTPVILPRSSDSAERLRSILDSAVDTVDLIISSGGVSAGAFDVVKEVLARSGDVQFVRVSMQPGKPQGFGLLSRTTAVEGRAAHVPILCLPGNPVSVYVSFQIFAAPALARMAARFDLPPEPQTVAMRVADAWRSPSGRTQIVPVIVARDRHDPGEVVVRRATSGGSQSHLIASLCRAEGLGIIPAETEQVRPGDEIEVMMAP